MRNLFHRLRLRLILDALSNDLWLFLDPDDKDFDYPEKRNVNAAIKRVRTLGAEKTLHCPRTTDMLLRILNNSRFYYPDYEALRRATLTALGDIRDPNTLEPILSSIKTRVRRLEGRDARLSRYPADVEAFSDCLSKVGAGKIAVLCRELDDVVIGLIIAKSLQKMCWSPASTEHKVAFVINGISLETADELLNDVRRYVELNYLLADTKYVGRDTLDAAKEIEALYRRIAAAGYSAECRRLLCESVAAITGIALKRRSMNLEDSDLIRWSLMVLAGAIPLWTYSIIEELKEPWPHMFEDVKRSIRCEKCNGFLIEKCSCNEQS